MKLNQGIMYFPRLFSEAQCPQCSKVLHWIESEPQSKVQSQCCGKIFIATLNYVGITIESIEPIKEIEDKAV
jgi:hypothetical protein